MKLVDKKGERRMWLTLLLSIPGIFFVLWKENGKIGNLEWKITGIVILMAIVIMYAVKWYANKK